MLQPGLRPFVDGHPAVDETIAFDRRAGWRGFAQVRRELRTRRFDVALVLQPYLKAGIVAGFAPARVRLGFDRARARDLSWAFTNRRLVARPVQHMQDQYLEFLDALVLPRAESPLERPIASIVVGTSKAEKDWPAERWATVCDRLWADHGLHPVLVGGRSARELDAERVILERAAHPVHSALGSGLRPLVGILDGSALVLSPDTGPLHVAIALDRPAIALMGYTNPKRVGPYRRFHDLLIDRFGDPGEDYPASARHRAGRMTRITVDDVMEKVRVWEERYRARSTPNS